LQNSSTLKQSECIIYGGVAINNVKDRISKHIKSKQPFGCDKTWMFNKVTEYNLTGNLDVDRHIITEIEDYLIRKNIYILNLFTYKQTPFII
jgi:hypothetical protein